IGALIMTHSDDNGVILPPRVASSHVVLMPIIRKDQDRQAIMDYTHGIADRLRALSYYGRAIAVEIDTRDIGGARNWEWIKKGIPLRVEIGPKDMASDSVFVGRRDKDPKDKAAFQKDAFVDGITGLLDEIQNNLYQKALAYRSAHTLPIDDKTAFDAFFTPKSAERPEIHGGFALSHWCGDALCEKAVKERLNVTIRCIPFDGGNEAGHCIECGGPSAKRVVFAKAY
ncbi:MAG: His/Gly/Thr/Pro-type tRNA ligase C-terminal domain-containing protein, partial [Desulfosalsimonadaceae bacterium]|nr:His/Gly/Thr/Pro-type tRNA ligase C-terminal domain-containing protein [Desulfosalsimonadaceae bacterium]